MDDEISELRKCLELIRDFKGGKRTTEDGYPAEIVHDEFAYKRIVDTYRDAAREGLRRADAMRERGEPK